VALLAVMGRGKAKEEKKKEGCLLGKPFEYCPGSKAYSHPAAEQQARRPESMPCLRKSMSNSPRWEYRVVE